MPAINLPLLESMNDLPIGVQLVGPRHGDARLLRTAKWLAGKMAESKTSPTHLGCGPT
jgi:Asp-tRNA(Asn)/Glu-tRNA(Gln) amidotransferase A subunit family amidase